MSSKPACNYPTRRSIIAAATGLAVSASLSKPGLAQISQDDLPEAAQLLVEIMPSTALVLSFTDVKGKKLTLSDYAGHGLLVNLWATWCPPCVAEIPSLDAITQALARHKILVLPIAIDINGAAAVLPFFASHHITNLPILLDVTGASMEILNAQGIPVSIIINPAGKMVARLDSAANWNTPGTIKMLHKLAGTASNEGGVMPVGF